jgi:hypothetical protein
MKISINSSYTYPTSINTPGILYNEFIASLSYNRNKAVEAAYHNGYITEDEAKQLKEEGYAKRNEYTNIYIYERSDKITLHCVEHEDNSYTTINTIFKLSYLETDGYDLLIDELNTDIAN